MRFHKLDLNLLVALDALLQERSVGLAADRMNLSQSAMSSALGRLRDYFEDELLTLKGRHMALTPRGEELVEPVRLVLEQIRTTIAVTPPFDPAISDRSIAIMASDYMLEVVLRPALLAFAEEAPRMCFEILTLGDEVVDELQRGRADILITVDSSISTELPSAKLFSDDYVAVGWSGNRALAGGMTRALYEQLGHVAVRFGRQRKPSSEEAPIKSQAIARRIEVVAPSFTAVPTLLVGSQRVATMHRKLAERVIRTMPLKVMELPFAMPPITLMAQWSSVAANDPALHWVIERLRAISQDAHEPASGEAAALLWPPPAGQRLPS